MCVGSVVATLRPNLSLVLSRACLGLGHAEVADRFDWALSLELNFWERDRGSGSSLEFVGRWHACGSFCTGHVSVPSWVRAESLKLFLNRLRPSLWHIAV